MREVARPREHQDDSSSRSGMMAEIKRKNSNATDHRWPVDPFYTFSFFFVKLEFIIFLCEAGVLLLSLKLDNIKTEFEHKVLETIK